MMFLRDDEKKILIGYSAKCGCTHIKRIFYYLRDGDEHAVLHTSRDNQLLPSTISDYTTFLIIRNPFHRLVSGFLNKYSFRGQFRTRWDSLSTIPLTFENFVKELCSTSNTWTSIDHHHFAPQTSERFDEHSLLQSCKLYVHDLHYIPYAHWEEIYQKTIPPHLLSFRGGHDRESQCSSVTPSTDFPFEDVSTIPPETLIRMPIDLYWSYPVPKDRFFPPFLEKKIREYFQQDFLFFEKCNWHYDI